jgi:hypothetical protein
VSEKIDQAWAETAQKIAPEVATDVTTGAVEAEIDAARDRDAAVDTEPDQEIG